MHIAYVVPSSGGSFYCGNCIRDLNLIEGLRALGQDVTVVPMYLPLLFDESELKADTPVFYGAVGLYLRQQFPWLRRAPDWVDRMLDAGPLLGIAAGLARSTRASGLGEMTLSMLLGEQGGQAEELEQLAAALRDTVKPDVVHLSNALLLGTVRRIKEQTRAAVVCSLQDEDSWIDALEPEQGREARALIARASREVEVMLPVSRYYAEFFAGYARLSAKHTEVIPVGLDTRGYEQASRSPEPPTVGFLSRMSEDSGLEQLLDALLELHQDPDLREIELWISGGHTGDDKPFLRHLHRRIHQAGMDRQVRFFDDFGKSARQDFFRGLSLFSVPSGKPPAFGLYLLESMAAGVPVVQPAIGAYSEIVESTGGGILYPPDKPAALAAGLRSLLLDTGQRRDLAEKGREAVEQRYGMESVARRLSEVYEKSVTLR